MKNHMEENMAKKIVLTAILAIALVLGMTVVGCGGGGGDPVPIIPVPQMLSYQSTDTAGYTYILIITINGSTAAAGDSYVLTITKSGESKKSAGTVSVVGAGGVLTLKPTNAPTFTVSTSGAQITAFNGPITLDDGETLEAGEFNGGNNNNNGSDSGGGTFTLTGIPSEYNGTYAFLMAYKETNNDVVFTVWGFKTITMSGGTITLPVISNGSVSIPLWILTSSGNSLTRYSGNHMLESVGIGITNIQSTTVDPSVLVGDFDENGVASIDFSSVAFSNGSATRSWSQGNVQTQGNNNNNNNNNNNGTSSDFTYTETENAINITYITITGYTGSGGSVTIPTQINGKPVTEIGKRAFQNCTRLTSVTIGSGITRIGESAFYGCTSLTSVTIPASVNHILQSAFEGCTSLASVTIPNSVYDISNYTFYGCRSLTSITIPNRVIGIWYYAFAGCTGLTSVKFEGTITSANFDSFAAFPGDLRDKYLASGGGIGTYTRPNTTSTTWTKQ